MLSIVRSVVFECDKGVVEAMVHFVKGLDVMSEDHVVGFDGAEIAGVEADPCCLIIGISWKGVFPVNYCRAAFGYLGEVCANFFWFILKADPS